MFPSATVGHASRLVGRSSKLILDDARRGYSGPMNSRGGRRAHVCFHGVGLPQRELELGEADYWIEQAQFLDLLDELVTWEHTSISFDDGNASDLDFCMPALQARGLTATFFVLAGRIDSPGSLGRRDLATLVRHGMSVGSHGMHHRSWRGMDAESTEAELVVARSEIESAIGQPVTQAACPFGLYDRASLRSLREAGYTRVHTSDRAWAREDAWLRPRFSVTRADSPETVRTSVWTPPNIARRARGGIVREIKRNR